MAAHIASCAKHVSDADAYEGHHNDHVNYERNNRTAASRVELRPLQYKLLPYCQNCKDRYDEYKRHLRSHCRNEKYSAVKVYIGACRICGRHLSFCCIRRMLIVVTMNSELNDISVLLRTMFYVCVCVVRVPKINNSPIFDAKTINQRP